MTLDDKLRVRLAEIRASAGVPHAQLSLEVLYFLPKDFLDKYQELFMRAVKSDAGESTRNTSQQQAADVGVSPGKGAKPAKRRYKKTFVVQDEKALALKSLFDKRLRGMAREIQDELWAIEDKVNGKAAVERGQCAGCRCFLNDGWQFCPRCGRNRDQPIGSQ